MTRRSFEAESDSVPSARRYVTEQLARLSPDCREVAALLVSELATNAVLYGAGRFEVGVQRRSGRVRIEVSDFGAGMPAPQRPLVTDEHGRGLQLVTALSERWGVSERAHAIGKTVWFELPIEAGP